MTSPHPRSPADLALAPVLINIERNLARVRDVTSGAPAAARRPAWPA